MWASLRPDAAGLVPCIVQDAVTREVRMLGYMNESALAATLACGEVTFFSRSKGRLWKKGESSGNVLRLLELRTDCDRDALVALVEPVGPTCHLGQRSCFSRRLVPAADEDEGPGAGRAAFLHRVEQVIEDRRHGRGVTSPTGRSYVRSLLESGAGRIGDKLREEADELATAVASETDERVAAEAADLVFHTLVALALRCVPLDAVVAVLEERFGRSGIDEKAARSRP
ncbi:MAG: bifunctional phosphoribosyl-AMP cyclohydrolase/phosphoribosyl-ATP diphosphatase HisIE [Deltaproteobacteria bacterium]|nr:MAG: bifunctional phosphoribosyl-AMP cyclohydrolase/phosphoribosyl-ATP diphosphatase HisIE [Deltaproteobacteria bacterium]